MSERDWADTETDRLLADPFDRYRRIAVALRAAEARGRVAGLSEAQAIVEAQRDSDRRPHACDLVFDEIQYRIERAGKGGESG